MSNLHQQKFDERPSTYAAPSTPKLSDVLFEPFSSGSSYGVNVRHEGVRGGITVTISGSAAFIQDVRILSGFPEWVGLGIGQRLYDMAIEEAKRRGLAEFYSDEPKKRTADANHAWQKLKKRYPVSKKYGHFVIDLRSLTHSKQAYLSPSTGTLDISVIRDSRPSVSITLDLGIPNFTVFSIKIPLVEDAPTSMSSVIAEAVHTLLDEMSAFMISMDFENKVIVLIYSTILTAFKGMTGEADTNKSMDAIGKDPVVKTFEGTFKLPMAFINETFDKVVTASSSKTIKRPPPVHRHLELTYEKPAKTTVTDARKVIRDFKNRSIKTQPGPMYVIVYDTFGNPKATIPIGQNFKNQLLKTMYPKRGSKAPQFTPTVKFDNDIEMKTTNAEGIPKSIFVGDEQYSPFAYISDDMALFGSDKKEWVVKFPDGRCVAFTDFPSVESLKEKNYPVPTVYTSWTPLDKDAMPEDSDMSEAVDEHGNEVIDETETESDPISDLKADDDKNEQLEEGVDEAAEGDENTSAKTSAKTRLDKLKKNRPDLVAKGFFDTKKKADGYDENGYWAGDGGGASGILPICSTTGRIGLAWRSSAVSQGDCWGTIGGVIQKGMNAQESAKMELAEETGYQGSLRLIPAFTFQDGSFKYQNFIGLVPSEFALHPMSGGGHGVDFADETDALEWVTWEQLQVELEHNGGTFHSGLVKLIEQSGDAIRQICEASSNK
jgi:8-oxo-dGTP pyrophosphatase MutT (NUDIX family)/GNAT superfamily N-acetyltransferase